MPIGNTVSSNDTGLSFAEETSLKVLPGSPEWYELEPNSYADFGGEITTIAREPINATRQNQRGTTTDLEAAGGFNQDMTQRNFIRLLQGFMFKDAHESVDTRPLNGTDIPITNITGAGVFQAASGLDAFEAGDLVLSSGNTDAANNAFGLVTIATATDLTTDISTVADAAPSSLSRVAQVGYEFTTGDATLTLGTGTLTLGATTKDLTTLGLQVGGWLFIGGDAGANQFDNWVGYGRIQAITATTIDLDKVENMSGAPANDTGVGKDIRIFFATFLKNADDPADVICRSYQFERKLGNDGNGTQSEYILGGILNEFTLNLPTADKANADVTIVGMDVEQRDGLTGIKSGARFNALSEDAINTSSDIVRSRLSIIDPLTLAPTDLFAFLQEATVTVNNNVSGLKAVGVLGSFSANIGNFVVGGSLTAYFTTIAATQAVRDNTDVTIDTIFAKKNAGMVYDIPLAGLGAGAPAVEKDTPITLPLEMFAAENDLGYTFGVQFFEYLPTIAMPA